MARREAVISARSSSWSGLLGATRADKRSFRFARVTLDAIGEDRFFLLEGLDEGLSVGQVLEGLGQAIEMQQGLLRLAQYFLAEINLVRAEEVARYKDRVVFIRLFVAREF